MQQSKRKKRSSDGLIDMLKRAGIEPTFDSVKDIKLARKIKFSGNGAKFEYVGGNK